MVTIIMLDLDREQPKDKVGINDEGSGYLTTHTTTALYLKVVVEHALAKEARVV